MSKKSKTKKGTKGGGLLTLPLEVRHVDALYAVINQSPPQSLLPLEKTPPGAPLVIKQEALWKFNELRKIVDGPRKPPPEGFDGEEEYTTDEWRKKHDLSGHFFPKKDKLVFFIPDNVKGVLKHFLSRMPNVLPFGVHLEHWEAILIAFRLTCWAKTKAEKALAPPDGEDTDFDTDDDGDEEAEENEADHEDPTQDDSQAAD